MINTSAHVDLGDEGDRPLDPPIVVELLTDLGKLCRSPERIEPIAFAGQGNFEFSAHDWHWTFDQTESADQTFDVARILEVLSFEVQLEVIQQRSRRERRVG